MGNEAEYQSSEAVCTSYLRCSRRPIEKGEPRTAADPSVKQESHIQMCLTNSLLETLPGHLGTRAASIPVLSFLLAGFEAGDKA